MRKNTEANERNTPVEITVQTSRGKGTLVLAPTSSREWQVQKLLVEGEDWPFFFDPDRAGVENLDNESDMYQVFGLSAQVRYGHVRLGNCSMRANSLEELQYALRQVKLIARTTEDI